MKRFKITWKFSGGRPITMEAYALAYDKDSLLKKLVGGEPVQGSDLYWKTFPRAKKTTTPAIFYDDGSIVIEDVTDQLGVDLPLIFNIREIGIPV